MIRGPFLFCLEGKPRKQGSTEICGPYYTPMGERYLEDILETMGAYIDILKFTGGSFILMPRRAVREFVNFCHLHDVKVDTDGFIGHPSQKRYFTIDIYITDLLTCYPIVCVLLLSSISLLNTFRIQSS
jgi:phosphosulfolactate synthase (CoM biosynthesis protein A)